MAEHGVMIALPMGKHSEPDGDEPDGDEPDGDEDGELEDHEYQAEADDVFDAFKSGDRKAFAHALEIFVRSCKG